MYIEESSFTPPWKLFTRILNELFRFSSPGSIYFSLDLFMLYKVLSELLIFLVLDLNNCPDVRHIVSLKFYNVYLISTLCFCTISFCILRSLMNIFYESSCRFLTWSFLSFYNLFRWAIREASWCFCNVYFRFLILSLISPFFYYLSFYSSFSI